jgi:hypothetical protein
MIYKTSVIHLRGLESACDVNKLSVIYTNGSDKGNTELALFYDV